MPKYPCGCINAIHEPSGILHSVSKCGMHRKQWRNPELLGRAYYEELANIVDGIPQCAMLLGQLEEAIGRFPLADLLDCNSLEIGCGVSMYAAGLLAAGYRYTGIDTSEWATRWTASTFAVRTIAGPVESLWGDRNRERKTWDLILAAHVLEHLEDAPGAIHHLASMLMPGGEFWIVVPDDTDPVNPDHRWFFSEATLRTTLESAGLVVERMAIRRHVPHENFLYACASRVS